MTDLPSSFLVVGARLVYWIFEDTAIATDKSHRINGEITAPQLRLAGVENEPLGIVSLSEAFRLAEEANVDILLGDNFKQPSFEWAETFCTILGDKVRIYTDGKFNVVDAKLIYYRKPKDIQIQGCINIITGSTNTSNV